VANGVHDTESSSPSVIPFGFTTVSVVHFSPLQVSASGATAPRLLNQAPTAVQTVAEEHDTPCRYVFAAPGGAASGPTVRLVTFQIAAMGT